MTYDPTKEYQTRAGHEVMLLPERDWSGDLHGMYRDNDGDWRLSSWCGASLSNLETPNSPDLDLVEKPKVTPLWLHEWELNGCRYYLTVKDRQPAEKFAGTLLSVKRIEITEGEGLEDDA